jgi:hypothetical protein
MITIKLEKTEALLLTVALREYMNEGKNFSRSSDSATLRGHATTGAILADLIARIEKASGHSPAPG